MNAAVAVIIKNSQDQLLLIKRVDTRKWENVGGKVDTGETPAQAACREVFEEVGITIEEQDLEVLFEFEHQHNGQEWHDVIFQASTTQNPTIKEPTKHDALEWFDTSKLAALPIMPYTKEDFERLKWI